MTETHTRPVAAWRRGAVVVFIGNAVARALGFLFPYLVARAVGADEFALAYFYVNAGFFIGEVVLAGFPTALSRAVAAGDSGSPGEVLAAVLLGGAPLLLLSLGAGAALAILADASPLLLAVVVVGLAIDAHYFAILRGTGRFGLLVGYRISANIAQLFGLALLVILGAATTPLIVGVYATSYIVPIAVIEAMAGPGRRLLPLARPDRRLLARLTRVAVPAALSALAYAAIMGLDVALVRILAPDDLAAYSAARVLAMPMSLFSFAIAVVVMPAVARADEHGRRRLLSAALGSSGVVLVAGVIGYAVAGQAVVDAIYPPDLAGAGSFVAGLALGIGVLGVYSVLSQWWIGTERAVVPAVSLGIAAIVGVSVMIAVLPTGGASGAVLGMQVAGFMACGIVGMATAWRLRARTYATISGPSGSADPDAASGKSATPR